jgi:DNA-binding transcriptional ArsR family regulator
MKEKYADSLPEGWTRFAQFFSALGDPTRQKILLVFEPNEEICVNEIARLFKLSRPAISHHLKVLRNAELLKCEKRGKEVYYRVNYPYCAEVLKLVHGFVESRVNGEERIDALRIRDGRGLR